MKKSIFQYRVQVAGDIWEFDSIEVEEADNGKIVISAKVIAEINSAIANIICSDPSPLKIEEFEFLAKLTRTKNTEIAARVYADPSTISRWKEKATIPSLESEVLKEFFWAKIFSKKIMEQFGENPRLSARDSLISLGETALQNAWVSKQPKRAA